MYFINIIYSIKPKKAVVRNRERAGRPLGPAGIKKDSKKRSNRSRQPFGLPPGGNGRREIEDRVKSEIKHILPRPQPEPFPRGANGGEQAVELEDGFPTRIEPFGPLPRPEPLPNIKNRGEQAGSFTPQENIYSFLRAYKYTKRK